MRYGVVGAKHVVYDFSKEIFDSSIYLHPTVFFPPQFIGRPADH